MNRHVSELNQNISRFKAHFRGGGSRANIGKFHSVFFLAEIGDRTEVRAVATAATACRLPVRLIFFHSDEGDAIFFGIHFQRQVFDKSKV